MLAQTFLAAAASRIALLSYPLSPSKVAPSGMASISASASQASWTCPPVSLRLTGRPSASTRAWSLLVRPPRERPMPRSQPPPFYPSHRSGGRACRWNQSSPVRHYIRQKPLPAAGPKPRLCASGRTDCSRSLVAHSAPGFPPTSRRTGSATGSH